MQPTKGSDRSRSGGNGSSDRTERSWVHDEISAERGDEADARERERAVQSRDAYGRDPYGRDVYGRDGRAVDQSYGDRSDYGRGERNFGERGLTGERVSGDRDDEERDPGARGYVYRADRGMSMGGDRPYRLDRGYGLEREGYGDRGYGYGLGGYPANYSGASMTGGYRADSSLPGLGQSTPGRGGHRGKGPAGYQRSDDRIKDDVSETLTHDDHVDASGIEVAVAQGEVTLTGTVPDRRTKRLAEVCIEHLAGVKDVHNHLRVQGPARLTPMAGGDKSASERGAGAAGSAGNAAGAAGATPNGKLKE